MKVPAKLTRYLESLGYKFMNNGWTYNKGTAYSYFMKGKKGYLITVIPVTGRYLVEILKRHDGFDWECKGLNP